MTAIEWTWVPHAGGTKRGETWNPQVGCREVSPACEHCYAAGMAHRGMNPQHRGLTVLRKTGVHWNGTINLVPALLTEPLSWREPRGVFVGSMTDLFFDVETDVACKWIAAIFGTMAATPRHTYMLLTKRPENAGRWFAWLGRQYADRRDARGLPLCTRDEARAAIMAECLREFTGEGKHRAAEPWPPAWPLPNVWIGVTAEDQKRADERVSALLDLPAAVRFVSYEPALGPVDWSEWTGLAPKNPFRRAPSLDWIIAGGESGSKSRAPSLDWMRSARDQCEQAGVAFFFKQWGEWAPASQLPDDEWSRLDAGGKFSDEELAGDKPIRVGKGRAGRLLDGRTHDEFPVCE
jgi:protein gp37